LEVADLTIQYFPPNPSHGDIFQIEDGVVYEYDSTINSWIKIASNTVNLPLASHTKNGAMTATDLKKLNRLVLPPPISSITGNDCYAPFRLGTISLAGGDDFVSVEGNVSLQNIDATGTHIETTVPFHIHQHTYGFDFNLDLNELIDELVSRGQFKTIGPPGDRGDKGATGDAGEDRVLSGPQGEKGEQGLAPECTLGVQTEILQTNLKPGLKRALTNVRVIIDEEDDQKYSLEFDRQVIGKTGTTTSLFKVRQQRSSWVLAVASIAGAAQSVYYLDVEPIINAIHNKFLSEVERLRSGYEEITKFWAQTMSDLFDEQKAALCCALEYCQSKTKSDHLRQHMEIVAATAMPTARIQVNERPSLQHQLRSGTALRPRIGQADLCADEIAYSADADAQVVESQDIHIVVDPILHIAPSNASRIALDKGIYVATIDSFDAQIEGMHFADLVVTHVKGGKTKSARFLNKGSFKSLIDAKGAYEGLSLSFEHDGGEISAYFHMLPTANASGNITIKIVPETVFEAIRLEEEARIPQKIKPSVAVYDEVSCVMNATHFEWYKRGWDNNQCCGLSLELNGQEYIIVKRSIGDERCCGGGENVMTPCLAKFHEVAHPSFAWPTLNGKDFAPIPEGNIIFRYDEALNNQVAIKIASGEFEHAKGIPAGTRHLAFQLDFVLFPTI